MKYFSMFSGIGGFELGIQHASNKQLATIKQDGQGRNGNADEVEHDVLPTSRTTPLCVGYSEIDKYAIKVYERNFNGHTNYGNATAIDAQQLPDFDLLVGGFPCQAFSIAGKRYGFQDTRGTLFFDIARILANKRPRHLVLENVKGLLSHDNGKTFQTILGVLTDLGYTVEWQVLNSKDFGVPQNRERVIIVGHLGAECSGQVFPIINNSGETIKYDVSGSQRDRVYNKSGIAPILPTMQGGNTHPKIIVSRKHRTKVDLQDISSTLTSSFKGQPDGDGRPAIFNNARIRRLTPKECERLQGFPDDWTKYGVGDEPISDTQRYKMCGNAVTTNVIQAVMERLANHEEL